ncbi:MAG: FHA domain-containing protein [Terriglobia bacterium]|jgi:pSer/pThr/pTyr-binding forkhead associated (FHA) protein
MARFVITDPLNQTQIFEISESTVSLGRADSNDLMLRPPGVSRQHARVTVLPGETALSIDLGSMNGAFVNGQPVQEYRLSHQDRINIGIFEFCRSAGFAGHP